MEVETRAFDHQSEKCLSAFPDPLSVQLGDLEADLGGMIWAPCLWLLSRFTQREGPVGDWSEEDK